MLWSGESRVTSRSTRYYLPDVWLMGHSRLLGLGESMHSTECPFSYIYNLLVTYITVLNIFMYSDSRSAGYYSPLLMLIHGETIWRNSPGFLCLWSMLPSVSQSTRTYETPCRTGLECRGHGSCWRPRSSVNVFTKKLVLVSPGKKKLRNNVLIHKAEMH